MPAAFCALEVFVGAAVVASDSWVSMLGDAAMLCLQESMWNDDSGASYPMKNDGFGRRLYFLERCVLWPILDRPFSSHLVA